MSSPQFQPKDGCVWAAIIDCQFGNRSFSARQAAATLVFNADGTRVAVLDSSQHVHFQPVEVDGDFGSDVGIASGLKVEDRIVANPGAPLSDGVAVQIDVPKSAAPNEAAR